MNYNLQDTAQWQALINAIGGGDTTAIASALNLIKSSIDNVSNAISNQSLKVDLSNITSDIVLNNSSVAGTNVSTALDYFNDIKRVDIDYISASNRVTVYTCGRLVEIYVMGYSVPANSTVRLNYTLSTQGNLYQRDFNNRGRVVFSNNIISIVNETSNNTNINAVLIGFKA